ncbi:amino acid adenylation domain-containing protein [Pantanalinema sp. GBBB05]|uniref:non-ribosomal peptide synthetase family protein n=1 Tax=Pantanalinema sp. GBBB05 TaxID=2604139 RepID=UPI001DD0E91F|nr:amino acid adenylation domain-containing protein [Pantanalinema sp. GBBB05]
MVNKLESTGIHQLVEAQVRQSPNAIAAIFGEQQITYQELNQKANQLANYLQTLGVKPETLVGVCIERSLDMLIGLLGVLKAGGAYVPLDPSYPAERLAFMVDDAQLPVLLTKQHLLATLSPMEQVKVVCLDTAWQEIEQFSQENIDSKAGAANLAYTIYTSGSTGKPKGVQILHGAVVNFLYSMQQTPGLTATDVLLAVTTISFDIAVLELFLPLSVGAQVVIVSRDVASDAVRLAQAIAESGATVMQATPATWRMLLAIGWQGNPHLKILCGGEALTRSLADQLLERSAAVWNMYGPTETTIWSMVSQVQPGDSMISVGHPIVDTQIYLLSEYARRKTDILEPVPVGSTGEVYIGGIGLARGYLNRPELTSERFVDHPFSQEPGARLYKTGDLGRYLPDGSLELIGRSDNQVKIRGHRIELGDIEAALSQHPAVRETAVVARETATGDRYLAGYVVLSTQMPAVGATQLRIWLKEKLPEYMVPAIMMFMEALPLTPNCKIDRRALPEPTLCATTEIVLPRTSLEQKLCQIWTAILGIEVGIYQDFFESGGDSLRAALLLCQIRAVLNVELSLECLFKTPTIAELAESIQAVQATGSTAVFATTATELLADAVLDAAIQPPTVSQLQPQHIFLTGATGFVGAFLLSELLQDPQAIVYCLVRADNLETASQRLRNSLENYDIWDEAFGLRIIPVLGDLTEPLLGLSEPQFQELADRIDVIYHSGAYVNLIYPYAALRSANVGGTQEVLRLATQTKTIPVHYISTLDVFQSSQYRDLTCIRETDELGSCEGYLDGYSQSKWVAEKLVAAARDRGLPVAIYRLGMVTGHSQTGAFQLSNLICTMIKGFIQLGYAPALDLKMNLSPVDYITKAIAYLSHQPESLGKTFHLLSPHGLSMSQFATEIHDLGYAVSGIPYQQWQTKLLSLPLDNALTPVVSLFTQKLPDGQTTLLETTALVSQAFDASNTQAALADSNIVCPPISSSVLQAYLTYFTRKEFLPQNCRRSPISAGSWI